MLEAIIEDEQIHSAAREFHAARKPIRAHAECHAFAEPRLQQLNFIACGYDLCGIRSNR